MRTQNTPETFTPELRSVSSAEIAQIIKDARLMRAASPGRAAPLRRTWHRPTGSHPRSATRPGHQ